MDFMEFWHIDSDGNGNLIVYPAYILGAGALILAILALIRCFVDGTADKIYKFANEHTWIVLLILAILAILICAVFVVFFKKMAIVNAIFLGVSLMLSLSLCYSEAIYWVGEFAESLEEVFIVALAMSPVFLMFMLFQMAVTIMLSIAIVIPFGYTRIKNNQNLIALITGVAVNALLIYLFFTSQLPVYIVSSLRSI